jgi:general secretion pathway protein C
VVEQTGCEALIEEGAEVAPGTIIAEVQPGRIILERGDQREAIVLAREAGPAPPADKTADRITEQEVYLDEVPLTWNCPGKLDTQIRLVPAYQGGEPAGVKVLALHPQSLFARSGLQAGDRVQRLNGKALHEPQQLIAGWQAVESQASLTVDLIRNGKEMTIQVSFR